MRTIIYLTDNTLDEEIAALCRRKLLEVAGGIPIVSVSQEPLDFGRNVCVGQIGRNWLSFYKQMLAGTLVAQTPWVLIAEHDCLYTPEHLNYTPASSDVFWYNDNRWLVQWGGNHPELNGMYSWWTGGLANSQLICDRGLLEKSLVERLNILESGVSPRAFGTGEPGVTTPKAIQNARKWATSGKPVWLRGYLEDYLTKYEHKTFKTELPNLDIRHGTNFTGPKRGTKRRYELPYWGRWEDWKDGRPD